MSVEVSTKARYVGISAQKARLVVDLVRGKKADAALTLLKYTTKNAAAAVSKVVRTAIADAEENYQLDRNELVITRAFVDEAPTRKWRRFGARGRFKPILRRSAHITIVVAEQSA
jgi:large subunit ribosomal protein L22